ncbi:hypothetical protein HY643_02405 [Candidatus Woesearchaeota archaeon]|nr:hypothetical protein [Candidatus Woesearchaeota archaeon]
MADKKSFVFMVKEPIKRETLEKKLGALGYELDKDYPGVQLPATKTANISTTIYRIFAEKSYEEAEKELKNQPFYYAIYADGEVRTL